MRLFPSLRPASTLWCAHNQPSNPYVTLGAANAPATVYTRRAGTLTTLGSLVAALTLTAGLAMGRACTAGASTRRCLPKCTAASVTRRSAPRRPSRWSRSAKAASVHRGRGQVESVAPGHCARRRGDYRIRSGHLLLLLFCDVTFVRRGLHSRASWNQAARCASSISRCFARRGLSRYLERPTHDHVVLAAIRPQARRQVRADARGRHPRTLLFASAVDFLARMSWPVKTRPSRWFLQSGARCRASGLQMPRAHPQRAREDI